MIERELTAEVAARLRTAGIRYLVGGSLASSAWGDRRSTNDADLEIWITPEDVPRLVATFGEPFHLSADEVHAALTDPNPFSSFQIMNMDAAFKFDLFVAGRSPMDHEAHARAVDLSLPDGRVLRIASAEHIFVQKVRWYDLSHRTSERQWRDLYAIARATPTLDRALIARWSAMFGLSDLAAEILAEADAAEQSL